MDTGRRASRETFGDGNEREARPPTVAYRVEDEKAAGAKYPGHLGDCVFQPLDMLEDLSGDDHVGAGVGERELVSVGPHGNHAVRGSDNDRRIHKVHADMTIAMHVGCEQTSAACDIEKDRSFALGHRNEPSARRGQPMKGGERPARVPPLAGELIVLPQVVSPEGTGVQSSGPGGDGTLGASLDKRLEIVQRILGLALVASLHVHAI